MPPLIESDSICLLIFLGLLILNGDIFEWKAACFAGLVLVKEKESESH
jgi:hypothetical protein